jgi:uncharacterized protein
MGHHPKATRPKNKLMQYINKISQAFVLLVFFVFTSVVFAQAGSYDRFFSAINRDDVRTLERLAPLGFDFNTPNPDLVPPLVLAVSQDATRVAQFLLDRPEVQVETRNPAGESPLMLAALRGHLALVERLIERKAHVNKPGWTPLHYAASHSGSNAPAITRLLLEHHAFIDASSPNGTTPLMMAAQYGTMDVVKILLEEGADTAMRNEQGLGVLDFAQLSGRQPVVDLVAAFMRAQQRGTGW